MFCFYIILVTCLIWLVLFYKLLNKIIFKNLKFTENRDPNLKDDFKPFERFDRKNWKLLEIFIVGYMFMPIRALTVLVAISYLAIICRILLGKPRSEMCEKEFPRWKRFIIKINARLVGNIILLACGFINIKRIKKRISDYEPDYKVSENVKNKCKTPPFTISNHVKIDFLFYILNKFKKKVFKKKIIF
jgi:hypothetical protein